MDGIAWIEQGRTFELGYGTVFVRGVEPVELMRRVGGELLAPEPMTWRDAADYQDDDYNSGQQIIRTGTAGGWTFAIAEYGPIAPDLAVDVVAAVSAQTEAVAYSRTVNWDTWFSYGRNGQAACYVDPCLPVDWHVWPGPLADHFTAAGLVPGGDVPGDAWQRILTMGETTFGLDIPRAEVVDGRLLAFEIR